MRDKHIALLSTRPLDGALIEKASYSNITIDTVPFIQIKSHVSPEVATRIKALAKEKATVVFTGMNAVEIVVQVLPVHPTMPQWTIYCLGGATFTLVKKYWPYQNLAFTGKHATELAKKISADKSGSVIFFCGNRRREELPAFLEQENIGVEELVVYETVDTPVKIANNYNGILFFSPSAVQSYFLHNLPAEDTVFFALGNTTANAIKQFSSNSIIVSDFPAKDQLVDKAIQYFTEKSLPDN